MRFALKSQYLFVVGNTISVMRKRGVNSLINNCLLETTFKLSHHCAIWELNYSNGYENAMFRALSQYKAYRSNYRIPIVKMKRSWVRLIFVMGVPILARPLYIETASGPVNGRDCHLNRKSGDSRRLNYNHIKAQLVHSFVRVTTSGSPHEGSIMREVLFVMASSCEYSTNFRRFHALSQHI